MPLTGWLNLLSYSNKDQQTRGDTTHHELLGPSHMSHQTIKYTTDFPTGQSSEGIFWIPSSPNDSNMCQISLKLTSMPNMPQYSSQHCVLSAWHSGGHNQIFCILSYNSDTFQLVSMVILCSWMFVTPPCKQNESRMKGWHFFKTLGFQRHKNVVFSQVALRYTSA